MYTIYRAHASFQILLKIVGHVVIIFYDICVAVAFFEGWICESYLVGTLTSLCSTDQYDVYERAASMRDIGIWESGKHF